MTEHKGIPISATHTVKVEFEITPDDPKKKTKKFSVHMMEEELEIIE